MSVSLAAKAKPAFFSLNYFGRFADRAGDLVCSSGNMLRHRLYDMDGRAQWTSAGSDDTTTETINAGLWLPGMQTERSPDFLAILNHNLKEFTAEGSSDNGNTWDTTIYAPTTEAVSNTFKSFAASAMNRFRLSMLKTQTANAEKLVGAIVLAALNFQTAEHFFEYVPEPYLDGTKSARMADNTPRGSRMMRSDASHFLRSFFVSWLVDDADELQRFRDLFFAGEDFLFMPRPGDEQADLFLCRIRPGTFQDPYFPPGNPDMRKVSFVVEEVGRA